MKLVSIEEMRRIEQAADAAGHSYAAMMEQAGEGVANMALALQLAVPDEAVLILIGPGNNGGDGLVAARVLLQAGCNITLYIWKRDIKGDENFRQLKRRRRGIAILWADNDPDFAKLRDELIRTELIVDALLGTGVTRPIEGQLAELLRVVKDAIEVRRTTPTLEDLEGVLGNPPFPLMEAQSLGMQVPRPAAPMPSQMFDADEDEEDWDDEDDLDLFDDEDEWEDDIAQRLPWPPLPVLAVDCPSGLNCDTGALDPATIPADVTVTFGYPKRGQVQYPGAGACGLLGVVDIDLPEGLADEVPVDLITRAFIRYWLPARPIEAHKGDFGRVMVVAGSVNYPGAALLSATAAMRAGAGLVTLAVPSALHLALVGAQPELTWLPLPGPEGTHTAAGAAGLLAGLADYDALLVGPGFTTSPAARGFIEALLAPAALSADKWQGRVVVDADALNLLAGLPDWAARLPRSCILTPHPGEMARLTGMSAAEVNARRIETAQRWAAEWGHIVLLKGPHTVVAAPDGRVGVLPFATSALATAGSGDVLAGAIAVFLAQGLPAFEAAIVGAYLHGHTGTLMSREIGMAGILAGDIAHAFPRALRMLYIGS